MKYVDPTEARKKRDARERKRLALLPKDNAPSIAGAAFREAAGKGRKGAMKVTEAVYKAARKPARKVI